MYSNIANGMYSNRIFAAGLKCYELMKLAVKPSLYKNNNSKETLSYILNAVSKGYTVMDIGPHHKEYIFDLLKISKLPGRLIAIETRQSMYNYLTKMKQVLDLRNIIIDPLSPSTDVENMEFRSSSCERNKAGAATIDFNVTLTKQSKEPYTKGVIDTYCSTNFTIPSLIKLRLEGNDLEVLRGAVEIMQKYKPQILIESVDRAVKRDTLIAAFKILNDLHYSGYFILDTIKVPLASFDFDIYQNEVLGFYCNNFLFE